MAKPVLRPYSRYSREALALLGQMIRQARIEQKMTISALAERTGVSRGLIQRVEKGDPSCTIGAVFEAAGIVGIKLFDAEPSRLTVLTAAQQNLLTLLPKTARLSGRVKDDF